MKNMILEMQNSYNPCNIRYSQSIAIGWQGQRGQFLIYTPALDGECEFDRNAKFLLTLINNKWPLGIDPGGHHFVFLNVSINKKPVFFS
jgi:hypothetical protein